MTSPAPGPGVSRDTKCTQSVIINSDNHTQSQESGAISVSSGLSCSNQYSHCLESNDFLSALYGIKNAFTCLSLIILMLSCRVLKIIPDSSSLTFVILRTASWFLSFKGLLVFKRNLSLMLLPCWLKKQSWFLVSTHRNFLYCILFLDPGWYED